MSKKILLSVIFTLFLSLFSVIQFSGCAEETIVPPDVDPNVAVFNNLVLYYWRSGTNDSVNHKVNLYAGAVRRGDNNDNDMTLIDSSNSFANFYFRSGALLDAGYTTRFAKISSDASQTDWDTLTVIPTATLDPNYFTENETWRFGYLDEGQLVPKKPLYAFYLQGKYDANLTNGKRIYGLIYVKNFETITGTNGTGIRVTLDVRYNRAEMNDFKP